MITESFAPRLGFIMHVAYLLLQKKKKKKKKKAHHDLMTFQIYQVPDKKEKLEKVIGIWRKRAIFDEVTLKSIEDEMRDPTLLKRLQDKQLEKHNELLRQQLEQQKFQVGTGLNIE
jgi:hypothetical protein